jgi:hypothetical protein
MTDRSDAETGKPLSRADAWLPDFRNRLAWAVFLVSTGGILLAATMILNATPAPGDAVRREIFSVLVPLFSTWVGTVLAFYFSRENFETANASVRNAYRLMAARPAAQRTSVRLAMRRRHAIASIVIPAGAGDDSVTLIRLREAVERGAGRAIVLRAGGIAKYVLHESALDRFMADVALTHGVPDRQAATLADVLALRVGSERIQTRAEAFAVVASAATLDDARDALRAAPDAHDVLVTATGRRDDPVEGWIAIEDLVREL